VSHPITSTPRAPLARSTLIKMGARIAVVIVLSTLFSYLHMLHTLRTEALAQLEQHVSERGQREQAIFVLAEDNHAVLKKALTERIRSLSLEELKARFDQLFVLLPDGTIRNRPEGFDGTRMASVLVPQGVVVDDELRRRILASYDVLNQYGPAFHTRFIDTYITLSEGPLIVFWPTRPNWGQEAAPDYPSITSDYYLIGLPEQNPQRRTVWSAVYEEEVSKHLMVSSTTPLDMEGRQVGTIHHDVPLAELVARTTDDHLPGAYNVIVRDDGQFITRPPELKTEANRLFERVKNHPPGQRVLELPESDEYLALARLEGPDWNFITVLPESVVARPAFQAARYVLLLGVLSLMLELAIMYWVLRQQISRPLLAFTQATDRVASGDFKVELATDREDELGQLASAFQAMANQVQQREEALRQANESLEQRVEERTRELKEVHLQLVQTARQAGMAEVATNVLHNVGNVLNSVYTSAQIAKERLSELKLEQVSRVTSMLQENQSHLSTFLTQDARGRHVMPFLTRLGQNLVDERKELISLLDDVGRYTEHIGDIVKVQQSYARTPRLQEPVNMEGLVEDALRINEAGLVRHKVKVERHLAPLPTITTDKHKVLMILVNLVSNAKYAMDETPEAERLLTVTVEPPTTERVRIVIQDKGMGIAPEMLTRIFQYGFTTRQEGHGFGLHSSALAAQELGGTLTAHSDGPNRGATFTLELPYQPVQETR
jgi:signal transduction histidine kinase